MDDRMRPAAGLRARRHPWDAGDRFRRPGPGADGGLRWWWRAAARRVGGQGRRGATGEADRGYTDLLAGIVRPAIRHDGYSAYADASLHGRDAAWAAVAYAGQRPVRASVGAGDAASIGQAETRAILLAVRLLEELGAKGPIYSDSREAVEAAQPLAAEHPAVMAVLWTPQETNRAADVLSKMARQTWQGLRKRSLRPPVAGAARAARTFAPASVTRIIGEATALPAARGRAPLPDPPTLETAIGILVAEEPVPASELASRIEARWPELLALRGRPEHSVRDALASLRYKGAVAVDGAAAVVRAAARADGSGAGEGSGASR
jgi:ribonuclease HI